MCSKSEDCCHSFTFVLEVVSLHIPRSLHSCDFLSARFRLARSSKQLLFEDKRNLLILLLNRPADDPRVPSNGVSPNEIKGSVDALFLEWLFQIWTSKGIGKAGLIRAEYTSHPYTGSGDVDES